MVIVDYIYMQDGLESYATTLQLYQLSDTKEIFIKNMIATFYINVLSYRL